MAGDLFSPPATACMNLRSSVPMLTKSLELTVSGGAPGIAGASAIARGVIGAVRTRGAWAAALSSETAAKRAIRAVLGLSMSVSALGCRSMARQYDSQAGQLRFLRLSILPSAAALLARP